MPARRWKPSPSTTVVASARPASPAGSLEPNVETETSSGDLSNDLGRSSFFFDRRELSNDLGRSSFFFDRRELRRNLGRDGVFFDRSELSNDLGRDDLVLDRQNFSGAKFVVC